MVHGTLATKLVLLPPRDPESKGRGAPQRLVRNLVHARSDHLLIRGLQHPSSPDPARTGTFTAQRASVSSRSRIDPLSPGEFQRSGVSLQPSLTRRSNTPTQHGRLPIGYGSPSFDSHTRDHQTAHEGCLSRRALACPGVRLSWDVSAAGARARQARGAMTTQG